MMGKKIILMFLMNFNDRIAIGAVTKKGLEVVAAVLMQVW
jgi:hypothetical protein